MQQWECRINVCGEDLYKKNVSHRFHARNKVSITSSSKPRSLMATTCIVGSLFGSSFGQRGNTTTEFGSQEWLMRAIKGETVIPRGIKEGDVRVKVFATNWKADVSHVSLGLV